MALNYPDLPEDLRPARLTLVGTAAKLGEMDAALVWLPAEMLTDLGAKKVIVREDFNINEQRAGNRYVTPAHVKQIQRGILANVQRLMVGTAILAVDPDYCVFKTVTQITTNPPQRLVEARILHGGDLHIIDFQHRDEGYRGAIKELDDALARGANGDIAWKRGLIRQSSIPMLIVLERDPIEIMRMFVNLARTKPIPPSLTAVMDQGQVNHEIAVEIAKRVEMLRGDAPKFEPAGAMEYLKNAAQGSAKLYTAAMWRTANGVMLAGFRDRTPDQRESSVKQGVLNLFGEDGQDWTAARGAAINRLTALWDYAYKTMPGWKEIKEGKLSREQFRQEYIHGAAGGLYVIAAALAAALAAERAAREQARKTGQPCPPEFTPEEVIDALATFPWERRAVNVKVTFPDGREAWQIGHDPKAKVQPDHPLFTDLVRYAPVVNKQGEATGWVLRTGGGNRTAYETQTRVLLKALAEKAPKFAALTSVMTLEYLYLVRVADDTGVVKRGRKPKAEAATTAA